MAFAKPLVVVWEDGFGEMLTPESAPLFLQPGWFGLGPGSLGAGAAALQAALAQLVASPALRADLGQFSRRRGAKRPSPVEIKLARRCRRWMGTVVSEDGNARGKIAAVLSTTAGAR